MAKIITAFVHEQISNIQSGKISLSKFVELLNEKANEYECTEEQAKINVKTMLRQCNHIRDGEFIRIKDSELIDWFKLGNQRKDFTPYDTM